MHSPNVPCHQQQPHKITTLILPHAISLTASMLIKIQRQQCLKLSPPVGDETEKLAPLALCFPSSLSNLMAFLKTLCRDSRELLLTIPSNDPTSTPSSSLACREENAYTMRPNVTPPPSRIIQYPLPHPHPPFSHTSTPSAILIPAPTYTVTPSPSSPDPPQWCSQCY